MTDLAAPQTLAIPHIPGAYVTVSYHVDDPEHLCRLAREVGGSLTEHHYDAVGDTPENWILSVSWKAPGADAGRSGVHFTAQGPRTTTPSLVAA